MRVGLLGGSFDPIHYGHLRAAEWAIENFDLQEVWFVPARRSPFKDEPFASGDERLAMLQLAVVDQGPFTVEDCELRRDAPSYTVDTLRSLTSRNPEHEFAILLGSDAAAGLDQWREAAEVRRLAEVRVFDRPGEAVAGLPRETRFDGLAISSTDIRRMVRSGRSIRYLTPESVRIYIEEKGLYK